MYQSSEKEKYCCFVFPSSTEREIRHFYVVIVQRRQRNVQKSVHVQSCCFANLNLLLFYRPRCRRRHRCLSSLIALTTGTGILLPSISAFHTPTKTQCLLGA